MTNEVDYIDVPARLEAIPAAWRSQPCLMQVPVVPANGLSIHKSQSLTIKHTVKGCVEGIFAHGHLYTMVSRCTDPVHFELVGLPPQDLLDEVATAWAAAGLHVNKCFRDACTVTGEWHYTDCAGNDATVNTQSRLVPKAIPGRTSSVQLRTVEELVRPQAQAASVYQNLLWWISEADRSSSRQIRDADGAMRPCSPPAFQGMDGKPIFPTDPDGEHEKWWLTDAQRRASAGAIANSPLQLDEAIEPDDVDQQCDEDARSDSDRSSISGHCGGESSDAATGAEPASELADQAPAAFSQRNAVVHEGEALPLWSRPDCMYHTWACCVHAIII